ncbi:hypothetical protein M407DRAFT_23206 [Tulasnella calospora MUT 4182]|uniref:Ubiquitin-like protease family profile domain-containing protein n=1 Tax=Tulasnella calospora MUT 4182 TaxID=1051891 RepID=A0A0C3M1D4_9AGAM|nr:hypothetical protein M407DRAFT_23206 [Tulasnella calospora MUT 4182]
MDDSHPKTSAAKRKPEGDEPDIPNKIARLGNHQTEQLPVFKKSESPWTYAQNRLVWPKSGRRISDAIAGDMVAILRFYGTTTPAMIDKEWLPNLEERKWLSSNEVSFYCYEVGNAYVEGAPGRGKDLVVFHCDTWGLGRPDHNGSDSLRHRRAPCALEYKYIAFPANDTNSHYFLCIILWPADLLLDSNPFGPVRTTALVLNSLAEHQPNNAHDSIKRIIGHLSAGRPIRDHELRKLKVHMPRMPQQPNSYDCGLYPGHFLSVFLTNPEKYAAHCTGEEPIQGPEDSIWQHEQVKFAREHLKSLITTSAEIRQAALDFNSDDLKPLS